MLKVAATTTLIMLLVLSHLFITILAARNTVGVGHPPHGPQHSHSRTLENITKGGRNAMVMMNGEAAGAAEEEMMRKRRRGKMMRMVMRRRRRRRSGGETSFEQVAGSRLPDCSHACGSCSPCRLIMVRFSCSLLAEAESCPMAYKCMCKNKSYPIP